MKKTIDIYSLIQDENCSKLVRDIIETFGSEEKKMYTDHVAHILVEILKERNLYHEDAPIQRYQEVMFMSVALHNVFYDGSSVTSLFRAREEIMKHELAETLGKDITDAVCQTIESQDWNKSLVPLVKPAPNSPAELVAMAIFIARYMEK